SYDGIPFRVGRIELVATRPHYRRRGLVRALMEAVHAQGAKSSDQTQAITGIPWYYRQFGYEMGLEKDALRSILFPDVPILPAGSTELYHIRPATERDLAFIAETYAVGSQRYRMTALRDPAHWQYELHGPSAQSNERKALLVIETTDGVPVGFLVHFTVF